MILAKLFTHDKGLSHDENKVTVTTSSPKAYERRSKTFFEFVHGGRV